MICDDFLLKVLASVLTEEFAPFEDANIEKVTICVNPELVIEYRFVFSPASLVEGQISKKVAAQYSYLAETLLTFHSRT